LEWHSAAAGDLTARTSACETTHYSPRLGDQCLVLALDERNMRAALRADGDADQAQQ
jgi:hypothetical protein